MEEELVHVQQSHFLISRCVVARLARLEVLVFLLVVPLVAELVLMTTEILLVEAAPHLRRDRIQFECDLYKSYISSRFCS